MAQLKNTTISDTGSLNLPAGTTAQRPASPVAGQIRYNTTISDTEYYDGAAWRPISDSNPEATGGTIVDTDIGGVPYRIHLFTNTGNSTFTVSKGGEVEYLIVAGGGSGGNGYGGGGGAGGVVSGTTTLTPQSYTITVGNGAPSKVVNDNRVTGDNGENSTAFGLTALGGGGGGGQSNPSGLNGGSGGGNAGQAGGNPGVGLQSASASGGFGNNGGAGNGTPGGGGGGAGSVGANSSDSVAGNGGIGISSLITGTAQFFAGGGGGGNTLGTIETQPTSRGLGGLGGGGIGQGRSIFDGTAGIPNTGGGSGGSDGRFFSPSTFPGGSGIVVVRYRRNASTATQPNETRPSFQPFFYNRDVRTITARTGSVLELDAANPIGHINDTWIDLSSRSRNPTVLGSLDFTGNSLRFPGDRINFVEHRDFYNNDTADSIFTGVPPQSTINWSGDCTYIAWVNPEIIDGTRRHVFSDNNYNEGEIEFVNGGLRFSWGSGNGFTSGDIGLTPNRWYQVVQTHQRRDFDDVFRYE